MFVALHRSFLWLQHWGLLFTVVLGLLTATNHLIDEETEGPREAGSLEKLNWASALMEATLSAKSQGSQVPCVSGFIKKPQVQITGSG